MQRSACQRANWWLSSLDSVWSEFVVYFSKRTPKAAGLHNHKWLIGFPSVCVSGVRPSSLGCSTFYWQVQNNNGRWPELLHLQLSDQSKIIQVTASWPRPGHRSVRTANDLRLSWSRALNPCFRALWQSSRSDGTKWLFSLLTDTVLTPAARKVSQLFVV